MTREERKFRDAYPRLVKALKDFLDQKPHRTYNARGLLVELGELGSELGSGSEEYEEANL